MKTIFVHIFSWIFSENPPNVINAVQILSNHPMLFFSNSTSSNKAQFGGKLPNLATLSLSFGTFCPLEMPATHFKQIVSSFFSRALRMEALKWRQLENCRWRHRVFNYQITVTFTLLHSSTCACSPTHSVEEHRWGLCAHLWETQEKKMKNRTSSTATWFPLLVLKSQSIDLVGSWRSQPCNFFTCSSFLQTMIIWAVADRLPLLTTVTFTFTFNLSRLMPFWMTTGTQSLTIYYQTSDDN